VNPSRTMRPAAAVFYGQAQQRERMLST
jgi:hypothetical protein